MCLIFVFIQLLLSSCHNNNNISFGAATMARANTISQDELKHIDYLGKDKYLLSYLSNDSKKKLIIEMCIKGSQCKQVTPKELEQTKVGFFITTTNRDTDSFYLAYLSADQVNVLIYRNGVWANLPQIPYEAKSPNLIDIVIANNGQLVLELSDYNTHQLELYEYNHKSQQWHNPIAFNYAKN